MKKNILIGNILIVGPIEGYYDFFTNPAKIKISEKKCNFSTAKFIAENINKLAEWDTINASNIGDFAINNIKIANYIERLVTEKIRI